VRALWWMPLLLAACSSPSRVRVEIGLGSDAQAASGGPAALSVYTPQGRLFENRILNGKLPGDVVVLVDDDIGQVRAFVTVGKGGGVNEASGTGKVTIIRGKEVALPVTLSAGPAADSDGDGVPDVIDDCPSVSDPGQTTGCDVDMAQPELDFAGTDDMGLPADMTVVPCGNGTLDPGEVCDDGAGNSDDPQKTATCTTQCKKRVPCGSVAGAGGARIDPATGHCYVAWPTLTSWEGGEKDCLNRGAHLVSITSKAEDDIVKALTIATPSWIGILSAGAQNVWSNGESNAYTAFAAGGMAMGANACVISQSGGAGWTDRDCSWPAVGLLPASTVNNAAYVCEHTCGNGVMDPGEECDPPTATTCTNACRKIRACTEPGGMISPATGYCYFATAATGDYTAALSTLCPAGTHLATPNNAVDTETARKVVTIDSWLAVSATVTAQQFKFDVAGPTLQLTRYHGFVTGDPDQAAAPQYVVMSYMHASGVDGWRDRAITGPYPAVCERD
jgi:hypothetical protein